MFGGVLSVGVDKTHQSWANEMGIEEHHVIMVVDIIMSSVNSLNLQACRCRIREFNGGHAWASITLTALKGWCHLIENINIKRICAQISLLMWKRYYIMMPPVWNNRGARFPPPPPPPSLTTYPLLFPNNWTSTVQLIVTVIYISHMG